jgi:hypothetical protein
MLRFDVRALTPEMGVVVALVRPDRPAAEPIPREQGHHRSCAAWKP